MASAVPLVREYAYVVLRLKMSNSEDSLTSSIIRCHYGNANDVFPVGGLVDIDETPIEAGILYCGELINFVQRSDMLNLFKAIDGIKDLVQIRILMYILDVKFGSLDMIYRTRYGAAELANTVNSLREKVLDDVDDYSFPPSIVSNAIWEREDEAVIQHWNGTVDKTLCFDFGILTTIGDVENNLMGIVGTTPILSEFVVTNSLDLNNMWSEIIMAIRLRICNYDLGNNWSVGSTPVVVPPTTKVLQISLPHCSGESEEIVDDHWIHAKRKLKRARIDINSREAVGILVDSFARKLGSWASDNSKLINE
jgi:hypothetical protein